MVRASLRNFSILRLGTKTTVATGPDPESGSDTVIPLVEERQFGV
jgi:hypothetical protein